MELAARGYRDVPARQLLGDDRSADRSAGTARTTRTAMTKASITSLCALLNRIAAQSRTGSATGRAGQCRIGATVAPTSSQGDDLPQFALAGLKGLGFASQDGSFNQL